MKAIVMQWLAIIGLCVLACITYGIVHDQVTARICVEYFTIGHPQIVPTADPTILGIVWGIVATWWVGVLLGMPLAAASRLGSRPVRSAWSLVRPVANLLGCCAVLALLAGTTGHLLAANGAVWLTGSWSTAVPADRHVLFLTNLWAHNASYAGGFVGGIVLIVRVWRSRGQKLTSKASVRS
jgi:hypothetical protein